MTEIAKRAAYRAIHQRFVANGATGYPDVVSPTIDPPYYHFFWNGGGETNKLSTTHRAELTFVVKAVSGDMDESMRMEANLVTWFDDQGTQDVTTGYLAAGTDWTITATMQESSFHEVVVVNNGTRQIYHDGFTLRLYMERLT